MNLKRAALLVVDVQKGFEHPTYWGEERNNPNAEKQIALILEKWRSVNLPVVLVKHCSTNLASPLHQSNPGNDFMDFIAPRPEETILEKNVNSAFIGTPLEKLLKQKQINTLVITGLTTDHCISTTARMAANLDFETILVDDATATYNKKGAEGTNYSAQLMHDTAIASLKDEFATIIKTSDLIPELKNMAFAKS
jgi:nicotinamidase-related amidase